MSSWNKIGFILTILIAMSCTDWKSKYWQSQLELERCQRAQQQTQVTIEPQKITFPQAPVQRDTIVIEMPENNIIILDKEKQNEFIVPDTAPVKIQAAKPLQYRKQYSFALQKDSMRIWITVENRIRDNQLIQTVKLDSLLYPQKTRVIMRTVNKIPEGYWSPNKVLWLFIVFSIILIAIKIHAFYIVSKARRTS